MPREMLRVARFVLHIRSEDDLKIGADEEAKRRSGNSLKFGGYLH